MPVACLEKTLKLTPSSVSVAPSGRLVPARSGVSAPVGRRVECSNGREGFIVHPISSTDAPAGDLVPAGLRYVHGRCPSSAQGAVTHDLDLVRIATFRAKRTSCCPAPSRCELVRRPVLRQGGSR